MEKTINTLHICDKNPKPQIVSNQNTHPKKHEKKTKTSNGLQLDTNIIMGWTSLV
jgi:hypothetical protein